MDNIDYSVLKAYFVDNIAPFLESTEMWQCITALGIKPFRTEDGGWCFQYGDEENGIIGYGGTIRDAAQDFFCNLKYERIG